MDAETRAKADAALAKLEAEYPNLAQIAKRFRKLGRPTDTKEAADLWDTLSNYRSGLGPVVAGQIYEAAGYKAFAGYPLKRLEDKD